MVCFSSDKINVLHLIKSLFDISVLASYVLDEINMAISSLTITLDMPPNKPHPPPTYPYYVLIYDLFQPKPMA